MEEGSEITVGFAVALVGTPEGELVGVAWIDLGERAMHEVGQAWIELGVQVTYEAGFGVELVGLG